MINFDILKANTKTIDLSPILQNISDLATANDIEFNDLVKANYNLTPKHYEIPTDTGKLMTKGLLKHKEIAVAMSTADADTKMENHAHEEVEIVKIIQGELHLKIEGEPLHTLKADEVIIIPAFVVHDAYFPVSTKFIAITLPACDTWPDAEN